MKRLLSMAALALLPALGGAQPAPDDARLRHAMALQYQHRFDDAQAELRALLASDPRNAQAWATLAGVQAVRGDSAGATASCARLSALAAALDAYACLAAASAETARMRASERLLRQALARERAVPVALAVWIRTLLGELAARRDDPVAAESDFRAALALAPRDTYLLGAYADFLLERGRAADVPPLLAGAERSDGLLLRQALAWHALGDERRLAPLRGELRARFDEDARLGDEGHLREQARFTLHVLGDAAAALPLAYRNWQLQKELADTRILLEAGVAAGRRDALEPVLRWVAERGLEDAAVARLVARTGG